MNSRIDHAVVATPISDEKMQMPAWMDGQEIEDRSIVVGRIARDLAESANPLIAIDAIDLAGAAEAINTARAARAVLDRAEPDNLSMYQEDGCLGTTPAEAALRADAVLLAGPIPDRVINDEAFRRLCRSKNGNRIRHVGAGAPQAVVETPIDPNVSDTWSGREIEDMPLVDVLGALRAHRAGRPYKAGDSQCGTIASLADWMAAANYGVAVFASGSLDDLTGHALTALLDDLSLATRWSALPLGVPPGQSELQRMALALTGLPPPLAFLSRRTAHDRWLFGAQELVARGETDFVLWVSSSEDRLPEWLRSAHQVAAITALRRKLEGVVCQIEIGVAGVDHPAILEPAEIGAFTALATQSNITRPSAAEVLRAITLTLRSPEEARQ